MELKADFFDDWVNILRDTLSSRWGYDVSSIPDSEIPLLYFNAEKKRPDEKIRKLVLADSFSCPQEVSVGWEKLKERIEAGEDLTLNLSKKIHKYYYKDPMLNDWGVHHFHLNEKMNGEFIHGTRLLVFALLADDSFYAIGIFDHDSWADQDIVEIMHRNWPTVLENHKIRDIISTNQFTESERLALRAKNANSFVTVNDGTVYASIGGGSTGSGFGTEAAMKTISQKRMLKDLEKHLASQLESLRDTLEEQGYEGELEIEASLEITETKYIALLPKYSVSVILLSKS